jgi:hypothetical protein
MGRKYINGLADNKIRKIFIDDVKKIYKRKHKILPIVPSFFETK